MSKISAKTVAFRERNTTLSKPHNDIHFDVAVDLPLTRRTLRMVR